MIKTSALVFGVSIWVSAAAVAQAPVVDVNSTDFEDRLATVERILSTRTESQHRIQAQMDEMQNEVDELRGAIEVHTNQLEKILQRQRELYLEIDKRVDALKGSMEVAQPADNGSMSKPGSTPQNSGLVAAAPSSSLADETQAYESAVNLILQDRDYEKAVPAFQSFIQQFPDFGQAVLDGVTLGGLAAVV